MADYDDRYRGHDDRQTDRSRMDRDRTERSRSDEDRYRRSGYGGEFRREFGGGDYGSLDFYGSRDYGGDPPARFRDEDRRNEGRQDYGRRDQGSGGRSGRDYGRTDYAGGMRDDMRRFTGDRDPGWSGYRGHAERDIGDRRGYGGSFDDDRGRRDDDIGGFGGRYDEGTYGARGGNRDSGYSYGGGMGQNYGQGYSPSAYRTAAGGNYDRGGPGRGMDRGDDDRGFFSRAGDEIASWFGSESAEQRRERDARQGDSGAQHHAGRGPRNYQRSDSRIQEDINDRLTADPYLDASDVEVAVSNGEATLTGTVRSRQDKRRAEDIADDVSGIRHVQNNLRVEDQRQGGISGSAGYGSIGGGLASTGTMAGTLAGGGGTATSGALNSSDRASGAQSGSTQGGSTQGGSGFQSSSTRPDTSTGGTGAVSFGSGSGNSDQVRPGDTASGSNAGAAGRTTQIGGAASSRSDIGGRSGAGGSGSTGSGNDKP